MPIDVLVLNYNGQELLADCLPSVLRTARRSQCDCRATVIDNGSTDGSLEWLAEHHPGVPVVVRPNRGLCSFNDVLADLEGEAAVLLNNDIRLHPDSLDPLLAPLLPGGAFDPQCFMTAPRCYLFDGRTPEGLKTAVGWRCGLVQATGLFAGHERVLKTPDLTASAGAALAVDRRRFLELGGFDPLYLPGRIEDLDFAYRGFQAGFHARYIPEAIAYHRGAGTFGREFGQHGCDELALRNTLLFQWKSLRHPRHIARQIAGLLLRLALEPLRAPFQPRGRRFAFARALGQALRRWPELRRSMAGLPRSAKLEWEFFERFSAQRLASAGRDGSRVESSHAPSMDRRLELASGAS